VYADFGKFRSAGYGTVHNGRRRFYRRHYDSVVVTRRVRRYGTVLTAGVGPEVRAHVPNRTAVEWTTNGTSLPNRTAGVRVDTETANGNSSRRSLDG